MNYGDRNYGDSALNQSHLLCVFIYRFLFWSWLFRLEAAMAPSLQFSDESVVAKRATDGLGLAQAAEGGRVGGLADERCEVGVSGQNRRDGGDPIILGGKVSVDARPGPVARLPDQAGADGVEGDIAQRRRQMGFIHDHGPEAALPEMAGALQAGVDMAGIAAMDLGQGTAKPVGIGGRQDQMDMIGHQHPGPDLDSGGATRLGQQSPVQRIVVLAEKHLRAAIATLSDVVRQSGNNEAGKTAHRPSWLPRRGMSIQCTVTVMQDGGYQLHALSP